MDTGLNTMTGGRLKRVQKYIGNQTFMMTYGDGVCDVNIDEVLKFHQQHGKMATFNNDDTGKRCFGYWGRQFGQGVP